MMTNFGWSYPAGCTGVPDDDYIIFCRGCGLSDGQWEDGKGHTYELTGDSEDKQMPDVYFCSNECREKWSGGDTWLAG